MYKRKAYARKGRKAPVRKYGKKSYRKTSLVATIKRTIHRMAENKTTTNYASNASISRASGAGSTFANINLLPALTQGTGEGQRIGNSVRIVNAYMDCYVNLLPYSSINNATYPLTCKVWIASKKNRNLETNSLAVNDCDTFFQVGNTAVPAQGNMLDMIFAVNKDAWTLHTSRSFELGLPSGSVTYGTGNLGSAPTNEGKFSKYLRIPLTKYIKALKYDSTSYPTNHNLWFLIQTVNTDGSTTVITGAEIHYAVNWFYEDL